MNATPVTQFALTLAFFVLIYLLIVAIYRLTFHPLAKYPGPFFSKISGLSTPWQCTTDNRHLIQLAEHRKYGPIVRIGPNTLSFSSPTALRQIYQSGREDNPLRKSGYYDTIDVPSGAPSVHAETDCRKHAARRRILDHAFTASALRSNEPYLVDVVNTLCTVLRPGDDEEWSEAKDMSKYFSWFAYDVMGALVFGRQFDCLTMPTHRYVSKMIIGSGAFLYIIANLPCQWLIRKLLSSPKLMSWLGGEEEHLFVEYSNECLTQRLAEEDGHARPDRRDIMHHIIEARDSISLKDYGHQKLISDACLLIAAGSDTTATSLAALFFYLTLPSSQDILDKLITKLRDPSRFPDLNSITATAAISLPYLRACIDEALRLAPPVVSHLPRTIIQKPGIEIDNHFIPAGTTVGAAAYVLHHDENVFPDSWRFNPNRWILDLKSQTQKINQVSEARHAFIPFSLGSRGCVGRDLAYREMCLCVARLLYLFDIRRAGSGDDGDGKVVGTRKSRAGWPVREDEYQLYDKFLVDRAGPKIEVRRRRFDSLVRRSQSNLKTGIYPR